MRNTHIVFLLLESFLLCLDPSLFQLLLGDYSFLVYLILLLLMHLFKGVDGLISRLVHFHRLINQYTVFMVNDRLDV